MKRGRETGFPSGRSVGAALVWAAAAGLETSAADPLPLYDFGNPNGAEQYFIEAVNRTRAAPAPEAQRFRDAIDPTKRLPWELDWDMRDAILLFGVNVNVMSSQVAAIPVRPPLAPNAKLMSVARSHSQWMFANRLEEHWEIAGRDEVSEIMRRVSATGYNFRALGENIYAYGRTLFYSHGGFEIDWGGTYYGMQNPPGHRVNNHSELFREVGVGALFGFNGTGASQVGPVVGTVDFGETFNTPAFVTGVAFHDLNGDGEYDPNEGIRGLRVEVSGATLAAETADGGGFAVPVPLSDATRTVTISGLNAVMQTAVAISGGKNARIQFVPQLVLPEFQPPVLQTGVSATVSFAPIVGATRYQLLRAVKAAAASFNCDSTNGVSFYVTPNSLGGPSYPVVQSQVVASGSTAAFHLAQPEFENQWIMLNPTYLCQSDSSLSFRSRLRAADPRQVARVQVSLDDGGAWSDVVVPNQLPQVGTGPTGQTAFVTKTVPLGAFAGRLIRLRFVYTMGGHQSIYTSTASTAGWFIDEISFANTSELTEVHHPDPSVLPQITVSSAGSGPFVLAARPEISGRYRAYGPAVESISGSSSGFLAWALTAEATLGLAPGTVSANPGGDTGAGLAHLVRYALGLSPADVSSPSAPQPAVEGSQFVLNYTRDVTRSDVVLGVEASLDLDSWHSPGESDSPIALVDVLESVNGAIEQRRASVPRTATPVYLRLRAVRQP